MVYACAMIGELRIYIYEASVCVVMGGLINTSSLWKIREPEVSSSSR